MAEEQTEIIRQFAPAAEKAGRLAPEQLRIVYTNNWFNLFVPVRFGGMGLSLPDALKLEEAIAWADGSLGWTVTLCSGANWFIGFLPDETRGQFFSGKQVCLAGSGQATGVATRIPGGFEVTGNWKFATGSTHATAFTANCYIERDGLGEMDEEGQPVIRSFIFLPEEVQVVRSWNTIGMVATASHGFMVNSLEVPSNRSFCISSATAVLKDPIYQYPFLQLAETTLIVNLSGMVLRFLELGAAMLGPSSTAFEQNALQLAEFQQKRESFFLAVEESWIRSQDSQDAMVLAPQDHLMAVSSAARMLFDQAMGAVDSCYLLYGLGAADPATEINRVWRNIHTASQHKLFRWADT
ncbi:hypothetical protein BC349_13800 [Flavihumibacter stibioxidans]|uniref:Acyl-CoA dehydrogenase C-terminal domain-containing protein n=1 Tax=Flavihumibacter stibioxidans TaxID=1834163 RepID=A0ABR7MBL7_9BACT|nr:hypothetical protein [Flavihumibacter stibioxidans]